MDWKILINQKRSIKYLVFYPKASKSSPFNIIRPRSGGVYILITYKQYN